MFREKTEKKQKMRVRHQQNDDKPSNIFQCSVFSLFQCCVQLRMEDRQHFHLLQELLAELEGMEP